MNINRNNYEEFFLLYIDNELSVQEKNAVDVFLTENPDLQEEMTMLRQSILMPDKFIFADKQGLLKPDVLDDEMQEQLLLLLDNELDKKATEKLTGLTKKDAAIKKEWEILQQTKLPAEDKIIFEDKAILYKKEGGRVIAMNWRSIAAAAVVIGFGMWGVLNYSNRSSNIQPETVKSNSGKSATTPIITDSKKEQAASADKNSSINDATAINQTKQDEQVKPALPVKTKNTIGADNKQKSIIEKQINDVAKQQEIKTNNLPAPLENINNRSSNNNEVAIVTHPDNNNKIDNNNTRQGNDVTQPTETIPANEIAVQTAYTETINPADDEEDDKNRKSKIGGFFKKIKRVVERKTNMKSGDNSFRIANMSFVMQ
jgi:hypothetical protein